MTGVEALQALRDGKNVRRSIWLPLIYAKLFDGDIVAVSLYVSFKKKGVIPIGIRELLQDDWELWNDHIVDANKKVAFTVTSEGSKDQLTKGQKT